MPPRHLLASIGLACLAFAAGTLPSGAAPAAAQIDFFLLPERALKPRAAIGADGRLHLVAYAGGLAEGNLFYFATDPEAPKVEGRLRVNDEPRGVRGWGPYTSQHIALGADDRIHVAYPSARSSPPKERHETPEIRHARLDDSGAAFEPSKNVRLRTRTGPFGGQSVAADRQGNVWVSWYGVDAERGTEAEARLFIARSEDGGRTFAPERPAREEVLGACYCCAMSAATDPLERLFLLYRSAGERRHRDIHVFRSLDGGSSFEDLLLDRWEFVGCPETGGSLQPRGEGVLAIWESKGKKIELLQIGAGAVGEPVVLTGDGRAPPRFPVAAPGADGSTLLAWTEGVGAKRAGDVVWQLFDADLRPVGRRGRRSAVKANSLVAVVARADGSYLLIL